MKKIFGEHWKSTLAGAALAVLQLVAAGHVDVKTLAVSAGIAILGKVVHDPKKKGEE